MAEMSDVRSRGDQDELQLVRQRASRERRRARNTQSLTELYGERRDIRGVSAVADLVVESTSWCA